MGQTFDPDISESDRLAAVTLVDVERHVDLKGFKCRNNECGEVVGFTNGVQLYAGAMVFTQRVRFACGYCGYFTDWRPVLKKIQKKYG